MDFYVYLNYANLRKFCYRISKISFLEKLFCDHDSYLHAFILIMFNKSFIIIKLIKQYFKMPKTSHVWFFFDKKSYNVEDKQVVYQYK
jgi:hypothetical protein